MEGGSVAAWIIILVVAAAFGAVFLDTWIGKKQDMALRARYARIRKRLDAKASCDQCSGSVGDLRIATVLNEDLAFRFCSDECQKEHPSHYEFELARAASILLEGA